MAAGTAAGWVTEVGPEWLAVAAGVLAPLAGDGGESYAVGRRCRQQQV